MCGGLKRKSVRVGDREEGKRNIRKRNESEKRRAELIALSCPLITCSGWQLIELAVSYNQ